MKARGTLRGEAIWAFCWWDLACLWRERDCHWVSMLRAISNASQETHREFPAFVTSQWRVNRDLLTYLLSYQPFVIGFFMCVHISTAHQKAAELFLEVYNTSSSKSVAIQCVDRYEDRNVVGVVKCIEYWCATRETSWPQVQTKNVADCIEHIRRHQWVVSSERIIPNNTK